MIITKSINVTDLIEQGSINRSGDFNSDTRVRNNGRINITLWEKTTIFMSATAVNGKKLQCGIIGYDDFSSNSYLFNFSWFDAPHGFDVSSYTTLTNLRLVIRYADESPITPQDLLSVSLSYEIDIVWRMGTNCPTQDAFPVIPDAIVSPSPNSIFLIKDGVLYQKGFPELPDKAIKKPYPHALWVIEGESLTSDTIKDVAIFGAFANAQNLKAVRVPESVKKIGRYSFRNTQLTSVTIASDCTYFPTSFPDGCVVNFYPD